MERRRIIVIGASAGGVETLTALFGALPADFSAPIFITIHLAPNHPSHLAEILSRADGFEIKTPAEVEPIRSGIVYVAPPNRHMLIEDSKVVLAIGPKENRNRPAINVLFRSAAYAYGPRVIGVLLSGTLDDGASGLWQIKRNGGITIVQDPADALYPEMPRNAIDSVAVDYVLPLAEIAGLLSSLCTTEVGR